MATLRKNLLAALITLLRGSILRVHIVAEVVQGSWRDYHEGGYYEEGYYDRMGRLLRKSI